MLPTVADLLSLDVIRRGSPQVVAGSDGLGARVRWVHVLELADAAHLLQGGELVLTTGVALPAEPALLARYAADLASAGGAGVSALAVELGRRYVGALPGVLVRAAADSGLTLIAFEREVSFVEITEAVHARIIDAQLDELRASERLHEVFTELSVSGASADEVVRQAAILAGRPVILADLSHRVLACEPGSADPARLLAGFARRSRALASSAGADVVRRGVGMAVHAGRRAGRGLGPGHPGLRRAARRHGHRADRAGGDHAGPRPPAHPARGEPGPAGPPHADHRHHQPGARRSGRGGGAVQGARGTGGRAAARRHGAQAARSGRGFRGRSASPPTPGCWTSPTRRPPPAAPSGSRPWSGRWTTPAPGPCSRSARTPTPIASCTA